MIQPPRQSVAEPSKKRKGVAEEELTGYLAIVPPPPKKPRKSGMLTLLFLDLFWLDTASIFIKTHSTISQTQVRCSKGAQESSGEQATRHQVRLGHCVHPGSYRFGRHHRC
jgi:hypothetical protein